MFCKWCGLESDTTDICSWCGKALSAVKAKTATPPVAEQIAPQAEQPIYVPPSPAYQSGGISAPPPVDLPPRRSTGPLNRFVPQGDGFDDLDDDLSPMPFASVPPSRSTTDKPQYVVPAYVAPVAQTPIIAKPPVEIPAPVSVPKPVFIPEVVVESKAVEVVAPVTLPSTPVTPEPIAPITVAATPVADPPEIKGPSLPSSLPPGGFSRPPSSGTPPPTFTPVPPSSGPVATPTVQSKSSGPVTPEAIPFKGSVPGGVIPIAIRPLGRPTLPVTPVFQPSTPVTPQPIYTPIVPVQQPIVPATPVQARTAVPLGDIVPHEIEEVIQVGEVDLGLQPLITEERDDEEYTPLIGGGQRFEVNAKATAMPAASAPPPPLHGRPSMGTPVQVPARGGRTWYCKWCGMQSENSDNCSWCKRDIRAAANATTHSITSTKGPVKKGGSVRQSVGKSTASPVNKSKTTQSPDLTKPQKQNGLRPSAGLPAVSAGPAAAPQIGTFQAQKSKYYGDKVQDPISGAIYDADTGKAETKVAEDRIIVEEVNEVKAAGINVILTLVIAGLSAGLLSSMPAQYLPILGVASFLVGFIMPILRSVPFGSDDSGDIALAIGLILIFGPFIGGAAYAVVCLLRQDFNPAIIGVFVSYLLVRVGADLGAGRPISALWQVMPTLDAPSIVSRFMPLITIIGWYSADPFKKADE